MRRLPWVARPAGHRDLKRYVPESAPALEAWRGRRPAGRNLLESSQRHPPHRYAGIPRLSHRGANVASKPDARQRAQTAAACARFTEAAAEGRVVGTLQMKYRRLGRTRLEVSEIGFG